jgi:hypothetical protein
MTFTTDISSSTNEFTLGKTNERRTREMKRENFNYKIKPATAYVARPFWIQNEPERRNLVVKQRGASRWKKSIR